MVVLIIAASARGLAHSIDRYINRCNSRSTIRSGQESSIHSQSSVDCAELNLKIVAADLFSDADTQQTCRTVQVKNYPDDFVLIAEAIKPDYVIYSGGLENHDDVIGSIERSTEILGNGSAVLKTLNNKEGLFKFLNEEVSNETGIAIPRSLFAGSDPSRLLHDQLDSKFDVTWLRKKIKSCGGLEIDSFEDRSEYSLLQSPSNECYLQEKIDGESFSAIFVAAKDSVGKSKSHWLANTTQLTGDRRFNASGFWYTGSILSGRLTPSQNETIASTGERIAERYALIGLFNIDFIIRDEEIFFLEINPRFSASMELLDRATGNSIFDLHQAACLGKDLDVSDYRYTSEMKRYGKAVWYSDRELIVSPCFYEWVKNQNELSVRESGFPIVADIPMPKTKIERGHPVFTVFADDRSETGVDEKLLETATMFASRFND